MIVWGGEDEKNLEINTGGRYDPRTDTWKPLSTEGAPHRRSEHSAVWTGEEMIVWGGATSHFEDVAELLPEQGTIYFDTGARYEPRTDTWREMSVVGAPEGRVRHGAIWTGSEMIVWGGTGSHGARYDPKTDQWRPIATQGAHPYYDAYLLAWTGREVLVWSGDTWNIDERNTKQFSGARYRPGTDTWFSITEPSKLSPSLQFSVWTGQEVIVAAATRGVSGVLSVEAYRPEHDTWRFINQEGAPSGLVGARAVWTGEELIVWQGRKGEGGLYDPSTDQWRPISTESAPPNFWNTTVWTGEEMIVWGGRVSGASGRSPTVNTGARYRP
jgi:N-acetylneuraminic acid mutarotase